MRDNNGFISLEKLDIQNFKNMKKRRLYSFKYNGDIYFYKVIYDVDKLYNELVGEKIAKRMNIPCAHYDLASYYDTVGVISKNIFSEDDIYISMEEILQNYFSYGVDINAKNNLEDIWSAISSRYKAWNKNVEINLINELINIFIFDILIANSDRHTENYGICENKNNIHFAKLIDNENMLSPISIITGGYSIGIDENDIFYNEDEISLEDNFVRKFLNYSSSEYRELISNRLSIISEANIKEIFDEIENDIHASMQTQIKRQLMTDFQRNYSMIYRVINENKIKMLRR